ncbi:hypothetical protein Vadar_030508 [Vaccinium darrowii]|uniref:Uncharacterized protein n=1 Tax=Vaccinium darrowii TaxID=229202 RepID=A0ACB7YI67_9ERIC|nr:hypothetical protein Vadar_030508 [Vaccinium darrowii]
MENWRIRNNSRCHLPPGLDFTKTDDDDRDPFWEEDEPTFQCSLPPGLSNIILLCVVVILHTTLPNFQTWELGQLRLWRWQLVAIFTFYGHSLSCAITSSILNVLEKSHSSIQGKLPHFHAVKRTFTHFLSSFTLLVVWFFLIDIPRKKLGKRNMVLESITKILSCVMASIMIWGFKVVVWTVISIKFHRRNYFEQIKQAVFAQYILRRMLNPLGDSNQMTEESEYIVNVGPNQMRFCQWRLMNADTLNDWEVWSLINLVRKGKVLSEMLHHFLHRNPNTNVYNLNRWNDTAMFVSEEIIKKVSRKSEEAFRFIHDGDINLQDLSYCMPKVIAEEAMKLIGATHGKFGKDQLFIWMSRTFQQQKGLELSLDDTDCVLGNLHRSIDAVVLAILLFAWLVVLNTVYVLPTDEHQGHCFYVLILSIALAVAYVYRLIWDMQSNGIRFFFRHPLRVGDTCTIDGNRRQVEKLNIYDTIFLTMAGDQAVSTNAALLVRDIIMDPN